LRFRKKYDFEITITNINCHSDSLKVISENIAELFYPHLSNKETYKNLIITINSKSTNKIGFNSDVTYLFDIRTK